MLITPSGSELNKDESADNTIFRSAAEVSNEEQKKERLSTGSKNIDFLLDGGLECGAITQFYGASKVGKTHLCHMLCTVLPLHYKSLYIDTQDGFSPTKIKFMAQARQLNLDKVLENILVAKTDTTTKLDYCIKSAQSKIDSEPDTRLLIVDSITHLYKVEYTERSQLPERQSKLNKILHMLSTIAHKNDIAAVITNQVHSNPMHYSEADKLQAIGGNVLSYSSKYIVNIEDYGFQYRRARLEKSPIRPSTSVPLMVDGMGFKDEDPFRLAPD
jgi:RecA/RadA recombinase